MRRLGEKISVTKRGNDAVVRAGGTEITLKPKTAKRATTANAKPIAKPKRATTAKPKRTTTANAKRTTTAKPKRVTAVSELRTKRKLLRQSWAELSAQELKKDYKNGLKNAAKIYTAERKKLKMKLLKCKC